MAKELPFFFYVDEECERCQKIALCVELTVLDHTNHIGIICEKCVHEGFDKARRYKRENTEK